MKINFDNTYVKLPEEFYAPATLAGAHAPELLAWNEALAKDLGIEVSPDDTETLAAVFSGSKTLPGSEPIAMVYSGHQFGHFAPRLGDGRAALLGEVVAGSGQRFDIQLKGSGRTEYSRGGDGKSWLGPVLREYVLSEAMHRLGVPTTRALAAVATGEDVFRELPQPGGIFTRVASSHIRVGTFQYFASRNNVEALQLLIDYTIQRHCPEAAGEESPAMGLFRHVMERQAGLVAHWMSVGFIHGVMNTDNTAISGETIDYGPAAYLDEFRFDKVFSSIDEHGRYAYANQPVIAQWNLVRFAETLLMTGAEKSALEEAIGEFPALFGQHYLQRMAPKLGLQEIRDTDSELIDQWLQLLQEQSLDFTLSFRELASRTGETDEGSFGEFESRWRTRLAEEGGQAAEVTAAMNAINPLYIPRNHRIEQAISNAVEGDLTLFHQLNEVLAEPYEPHAALEHLAEAPEASERVTRTFCGT